MSDHNLAEALRQIIYQAERGTLARCEQLARDALASIYEAEQAEEAQPLTDEQIAVLKFLDGSGLLRGVGYDCQPDGERRPFWWRKQLGDAFPQIRAHGITKDTK